MAELRLPWWERLAGALRRPAVPDWSLASYRSERLAQLVQPALMGVLEGGFVGVVADKTFAVHPVGIAVISAAPMFANLASALWARLSERVRKVPLIVGIQLCMAVCVLGIAGLPESRAGAAGLVALVVVSRLLISGLITVRSVVWTLNYPDAVRARVTSRLTLIALVGMAGVSWLGSMLLDADPARFRSVFALAALCGVLGALAFSRVRMRGEERRGDAPLGRASEPSPAGASLEPGTRPQLTPGVFAILRDDPLFARYLACQFLLGTANMMMEAPLVLLVSRELGASYQVSIGILMVVPLAISVVSVPLSAVWIDHVHIARFRARHSWLWVASLLLTWVGAAAGSLLWIGVGRAVLGSARGGGMLAWQLGHNDFSHPERAGAYMALHATLTGVRGAIAPFLGMGLYLGWGAISLPGLGLELPAMPGIGAHVWAAAALLSSVATLGFVQLDRRIRREVR